MFLSSADLNPFSGGVFLETHTYIFLTSCSPVVKRWRSRSQTCDKGMRVTAPD